MTEALATVRYKPTDIGTERLGAIMVKSGYFKDTRDEAQAIVKILYGAELGFGPMASMLGCYIVDGRPSLSAQLIAAAIQKSGSFDYRVREWTDQVCRIEFFSHSESLGESSFSIDDAKRAGLVGKGPWHQYPKAMLWARAMSQGARAFTPGVFNGAIYTPEELNQDQGEQTTVDISTGEVLERKTRSLDELSQSYQRGVQKGLDEGWIDQDDAEGWILDADADRADVMRGLQKLLSARVEPAERSETAADLTSSPAF